MNQAQNTPVHRAKREVHTSDTPINELANVDLSLDKELDRERIVIPVDSVSTEYAESLAFAEQPVTIFIQKSAIKNAPTSYLCGVNGKGAEVFMNGKWVEFNYLPVNAQLVTKRKYVEVLARAKETSYTTAHDEPGAEHVHNHAIPSTTRAVNFSVVGDTDPRGAQWLQRLLSERE